MRAMKDAGAFGARLTGAGWGGCVVALVRTSQMASVMHKIWGSYYRTNPQAKEEGDKAAGTSGDQETVLFASRPCAGAAVLPVPGVRG